MFDDARFGFATQNAPSAGFQPAVPIEQTCPKNIYKWQREHDYLENELNACLKEWNFEGAAAFKEPKIEICRTDKYPLEYPTTRMVITELKKMGFLVTEKNAVKEFEDFEEEKILPIIELFSRIVYEVFSLYGNKKGKIKFKK